MFIHYFCSFGLPNNSKNYHALSDATKNHVRMHFFTMQTYLKAKLTWADAPPPHDNGKYFCLHILATGRGNINLGGNKHHRNLRK